MLGHSCLPEKLHVTAAGTQAFDSARVYFRLMRGKREGCLSIVGAGIRPGSQTTPEALKEIQSADRVLYLLNEDRAEQWLRRQNRQCRSLASCYRDGEDRFHAYERMVAHILEPLRSGFQVCAVFYGHPGVLVRPAHDAIRMARREGFQARMLPGISAEACLFADLGFDPGAGYQSLVAADLVNTARRFDPETALVLWQVVAVSDPTYRANDGYRGTGRQKLVDSLLQHYSPDHEIVIYEAADIDGCEPSIRTMPLARLQRARFTSASTVFVPPRSR